MYERICFELPLALDGHMREGLADGSVALDAPVWHIWVGNQCRKDFKNDVTSNKIRMPACPSHYPCIKIKGLNKI